MDEALAMSDAGMPSNAEQRISVASSLVERLVSDGVDIDDIYVDPLVYPAATGAENTSAVLETIRTVRSRYPGVHASCGLSNVSHGLPVRKLLNQAFLVMAVSHGMDAAIIDPLDRRLMALLSASLALLGQDEFCMEYLTAAREGKFEGLV
jgi:5-methyltetrahydrofolate--homocysteine methyltransferase